MTFVRSIQKRHYDCGSGREKAGSSPAVKSRLWLRLGFCPSHYGPLLFIRRRFCDIFTRNRPKKIVWVKHAECASQPPPYEFHIDDSWKPRGNKAKGDNRPYVRTNEGTVPGLPQADQYDPRRLVWYFQAALSGWKAESPLPAQDEAPDQEAPVRKLFELLCHTPVAGIRSLRSWRRCTCEAIPAWAVARRRLR